MQDNEAITEERVLEGLAEIASFRRFSGDCLC